MSSRPRLSLRSRRCRLQTEPILNVALVDLELCRYYWTPLLSDASNIAEPRSAAAMSPTTSAGHNFTAAILDYSHVLNSYEAGKAEWERRAGPVRFMMRAAKGLRASVSVIRVYERQPERCIQRLSSSCWPGLPQNKPRQISGWDRVLYGPQEAEV